MELLITMAILLVLAALVFAISRKAMTSAKMANKTSMYRQHFVAAASYSADHGGRVCPARDIQGWQVILLPYLMGEDVPVTPETRTSEYFVDPLWKKFNPKKPWVTGVGINFRPGLPRTNRMNIYWGDDRDAKSAKIFKTAEITEPSRRIFSGDSRSWYISPWHVDTSRHHDGNKGMFVMFDGAVTFLDAEGAKRAINNPSRPSSQ